VTPLPPPPRHRRSWRTLVGLGLLLLAPGLADCACNHAKGDPAVSEPHAPVAPAAGPFSCDRAPSLLGYPGATASQCAELLPSFWRVVLEGGDLPHGTIFRTVWDGPREVTERGEAALGAYLRRANLSALPALDRWKTGQLLEALGALPPGFAAEHLDSARDPSTGLEGSAVASPLRLTLYAPGYTPKPAAAAPAAPGEPAGPGGPGPAGPVGMVPTGPAGAAPGGPGGPGGGYSPPSLGRAVLEAQGDAFTWTVDWRPGPDQAWQRVSQSSF
jgi:hypothetical protein